MPSLIQDLVAHALRTHYLSTEAEERLRQRLHDAPCPREDLRAFMRLQWAAMDGEVQQQSRLCCAIPEHIL
ncbi:MAG: hypothetical protein F6J87_14315 [Spirulina sp. SIO3F2]|nr:hypothetical protein [Spirulina sp. SIO3F2]